MIVTVTANPAIDRTLALPHELARGEVQRLTGSESQAGGKGINVSRALRASKLDNLAVFPASAEDDFTHLVEAEGLRMLPVRIEGNVRTNFAVTETDGTTTKLNEPGPHLSGDEAEALVSAVVAASRDADWLVLAGSLPLGVDSSFYAVLIEAVRAELGDAAPRVAVDSSDAPLEALLASGTRVQLIKPNAFELAELSGIADGDTLEADPQLAADAAGWALDHGADAVLATLGGAGAIYRDATTSLFATPPPTRVRSTVGAGDSSLAGYLLASVTGATPERALAQAVAHGSAAASLPGSGVPSPEQTQPDLVRITHLAVPGEHSNSIATSTKENAS